MTVPTEPTITQLAKMTKAEREAMAVAVAALPEAERIARRARMLRDQTPVMIKHVAVMAGVGRGAVSKWRGKYLATGEVSDEALIEPDPDLSPPDVRKPGETKTSGRGDSPVWRAGDIWRWLRDTERTDEDHNPRPGGRKPPGRPPTQRTAGEPVLAGAAA